MKKIDINEFIGNKIREFRSKNNISQEELAEYLNTTPQTISRYEKGQRKTNQDILFNLAEYFKVSINDFFPAINHEDSIKRGGIIELNFLSQKTNISVDEIIKIYYGEEKLPNPRDLIALAEALNDDPFDYLENIGYVTLDFDKNIQYNSNIRFLLNEEEKQIIYNFLTKRFDTTKDGVNRVFFSNRTHTFSKEEIRYILKFKTNDFKKFYKFSKIFNDFDYKQFLNFNNDSDIKEKIDISDLKESDKEQIKYMIDLMRKNKV